MISGVPWTPEDDERLRAFHATDLDAVQIAARFEGRTPDAVKGRFRKLKLGVREMARTQWTDAEYEILKGFWNEPGVMKTLCAKYLPKRSARMALEHGAAIGLPPRPQKAHAITYSWVTDEIVRVLTAEPNLTVQEIVARCAGSRKRISELLRTGHGSRYYKSGWERVRTIGNGGWWPRWSLGAGPDVPAPVPLTDSQNSRNHRARRRVLAGRIDPFATLVQQVAQ